MSVVIVAEKPSAARNFGKALGGMSGSYKGQAYKITNLRGHLYEFAQPHEMVPPALTDQYRAWDVQYLPWDLGQFDWKREPSKNAADVIKTLRSALSSATEIVCGTDLDPSGEGDLLFWEAIEELGFLGKKFSRMEFTDESEASIRKAFENRRSIRSMTDEGDYRKALYRQKFDFGSIQWSRIATAMGRASGEDLVLRQGRLKSAMVLLVGDQLKAHNDYVKKPFFQNRFRDENNVVYTNPQEPRFDAAEAVPQSYTDSPVVLDSRTDKTTAPPKLLDLASLSSMLVGKGVKAKQTLETYQRMYEAQIVSYPRTEDKTITPEQFNEMVPLIDKIAGVVNVDTSLLTHRSARKTHVKAQGAHGANRPGPKVPASLSAIEKEYGKAGALIYETLAKNFLAIVAPDYEYEQQKGHLEKYPDFLGVANVPRSAGWKAVYDPNAGDESNEGEEDENSVGLGKNASPFVFEGANKRPEHPTMTWLMKQLEKRDVGTGATRTSTYSEVTNEKTKYPLLVETGRKVTLAKAGEMSWRLLPGTHIGDLGLTEKVYADMAAIAKGQTTAQECLKVIADWVRQDIETMTKNAVSMRESMGLKEQAVSVRAEGVWQAAPGGPRKVAFKKIWSGHEFSDQEVAKLLAGEEISFEAIARTGRPFQATGALGAATFKGRPYVGFQLKIADKPTKWSGHTFTDAQVADLLAGKKLEITDFVSAKTGRTFGCTVSWDPQAKRIVPEFADSSVAPPAAWCGHTFTADELSELAAGKKIHVKGLKSKAGKTFDADLQWKKEGDRKKIVPSFG